MKYYPHDSNAFQDEKITLLYMEYGYAGLGLFYTVLEKLTYHERPINTKVLKKQLDVGKKLEKCWAYMEEIGLLVSKNGETFNSRVMEYCETLDEKREKTNERVSKFRNKRTKNDQTFDKEPPKFVKKPSDFEQSLSNNDKTLSNEAGQTVDNEPDVNPVTRYNDVGNAPNIDRDINIDLNIISDDDAQEEIYVLKNVEENRAEARSVGEKIKAPPIALTPPQIIDNYHIRMLADEDLIDAAAVKGKVHSNQFHEALGEFITDKKAIKHVPESETDFRQHFLNWLPGWKLRKESPSKTYPQTNGKSISRTSGSLRPTSQAEPNYRGTGTIVNVELD